MARLFVFDKKMINIEQISTTSLLSDREDGALSTQIII
jgi:hypothetical protein